MENSSLVPLKRNSEFLDLKKKGQRHWPAQWLLLNYRFADGGGLKMGVTASRKVGSAVIRNRLKRWCREYFRSLVRDGRHVEAEINVIFKPVDSGFYKGLRHEDLIAALDRGLENLRKQRAKRAAVSAGAVP